MFFQETTPDTSGYMIAGFVITFLILAVFVASIYIRNRNLKQDMDLLAELEQPAASEEKPKRKSPKPVTKKNRKK
ncbi:MAG: hypothetical protein DCC56_15510 [Anaerolineae bacterium]|nr:MAG: hypothetical protein DCC56_15510 [Anaerolineae bacterium]WKZ45620.1 MAG: hypothetical protein QY302_07490 [Anaerolineales bacterium]WKZ48251.1 MAG: hypothetical protein QY306_02645 [Anaerolineales bacterium]